MLSRAFASVLLLLLPALASAGPVDPVLFDGLRWRSIGPFRGGRVLAVTGVPGEREHFYFGSVNGGALGDRLRELQATLEADVARLGR